MHRFVAGVLAGLLVVGLGWTAAPGPAAAASADPKVVLVVGATHGTTSTYRSYMNVVAATAAKYTSNLVKVYSPNATWSKVRSAMQGASIVVYMGHGNGFPSPYSTTLNVYSQNGMGLNKAAGRGRQQHEVLRREVHRRRGGPRPERPRDPQPPLLRLRQLGARQGRAVARDREGADGQLRRRVHPGGRPRRHRRGPQRPVVVRRPGLHPAPHDRADLAGGATSERQRLHLLQQPLGRLHGLRRPRQEDRDRLQRLLPLARDPQGPGAHLRAGDRRPLRPDRRAPRLVRRPRRRRGGGERGRRVVRRPGAHPGRRRPASRRSRCRSARACACSRRPAPPRTAPPSSRSRRSTGRGDGLRLDDRPRPARQHVAADLGRRRREPGALSPNGDASGDTVTIATRASESVAWRVDIAPPDGERVARHQRRRRGGLRHVGRHGRRPAGRGRDVPGDDHRHGSVGQPARHGDRRPRRRHGGAAARRPRDAGRDRRPVFTPNGDGTSDSVAVGYVASEAGSVRTTGEERRRHDRRLVHHRHEGRARDGDLERPDDGRRLRPRRHVHDLAQADRPGRQQGEQPHDDRRGLRCARVRGHVRPGVPCTRPRSLREAHDALVPPPPPRRP